MNHSAMSPSVPAGPTCVGRGRQGMLGGRVPVSEPESCATAGAEPLREAATATPEFGRIGVVLAGGGAKGAYQIGCLRALRQAGLTRFSAIAGSSVGAIHAVMLAADKLDEAEDVWQRLRWCDVARIATERLHLIPLWMLAAFKSEFSPFTISRLSDSVTHPGRWRRWAYPLACAAVAAILLIAGWVMPRLETAAGTLAVLVGASGAIAALHKRLRPHFLGSTFMAITPLTAYLDAALSDSDWRRVGASRVPIYGVVSQFRPHTHESIPWGGWVPRYVRLDRLTRREAIDTLVAGSALPGFSGVTTLDGETALDGAWTDNVPSAPLLFDADLGLDLVFVIYLKNIVRHERRHNSLHGVASLLLRETFRTPKPHDDELLRWATLRWEASGQTCAGSRPLPSIVPVVPSRRVGNFFSGTLWFSAAQSKRLIELGRRDMERVLAGRAGWSRAAVADVSRRPTADTRPGTPAAKAAQALS